MDLLEKILSRDNLTKAFKRVVGNKGSAGIDGMTVDDLKSYLSEHWQGIKTDILSGSCRLLQERNHHTLSSIFLYLSKK